MRLRTLAVLGGLATVACGPVRAANDRGDPIYTLQATLQGAPLPEPEGEYRAVFGWLSYGGGPWVDCVASGASIADCGIPAAMDYETQLTIFDVEAQPRFPNGLDVPFYDFPGYDEVLTYGESTFALGGMAIYDDRNLNGELDPVEPTDPEPVDTLVAESIVTNLRTAAVFQEGPDHPIKTGLDLILSCPRAPYGYSVGSVLPREGCKISEDNLLLVTRSDSMQVGRARCGGQIANLQFLDAVARPPDTLPANANIRCGAPNEIFVSLDNGRFCDRYRESRYSLVSGPLTPPAKRWDLRDDPPDYWSCPIQ